MQVDSEPTAAVPTQQQSRPDKRTQTQLRTMGCVMGMLARADGSAKFSFGGSSVVCSIYGPMAARPREELMDSAYIQVQFDPATGASGTQERLYERYICDIAKAAILTAMHPRTTLRITVQVLSNDGSILATALNAVLLALMDAGVPLQTTFSAVACSIHRNGMLLLDPIDLESNNAQSNHTLVYDSTTGDIMAVYSSGLFTQDE
eukprot:jgi/Hompol1/1420/HPOL_005519-RA